MRDEHRAYEHIDASHERWRLHGLHALARAAIRAEVDVHGTPEITDDGRSAAGPARRTPRGTRSTARSTSPTRHCTPRPASPDGGGNMLRVIGRGRRRSASRG